MASPDYCTDSWIEVELWKDCDVACTSTVYVPLGVVPLLGDGGDAAIGPGLLLVPFVAPLQPTRCAMARSTIHKARRFFFILRHHGNTRASPNMGTIKAYVGRVRFRTGETFADAKVVWTVSVVATCPRAVAEAGENTQFAPIGRLAQEKVKVWPCASFTGSNESL